MYKVRAPGEGHDVAFAGDDDAAGHRSAHKLVTADAHAANRLFEGHHGRTLHKRNLQPCNNTLGRLLDRGGMTQEVPDEKRGAACRTLRATQAVHPIYNTGNTICTPLYTIYAVHPIHNTGNTGCIPYTQYRQYREVQGTQATRKRVAIDFASLGLERTVDQVGSPFTPGRGEGDTMRPKRAPQMWPHSVWRESRLIRGCIHSRVG